MMFLSKTFPSFLTRFLAVFCAAGFMLCLSAAPSFAVSQSDVNRWLALRDTARQHDFQSYARFINRFPGWPEQNVLLLQAEKALLASGDRRTLIDWFKTHAPQTDEGRLRFIASLMAANETVDATLRLQQYWHQGFFDTPKQAAILKQYPKALRQEDHIKRLDTLLWQNKVDRAQTALDYVTDKTANDIGRARIRLQRFDSRAFPFVTNLSATAALDNGVLFDLARYYRQKNRDNDARKTMAKRRQPYGEHAAKWWRERAILARRAIERNDFKRAYDIVAAHGHDGGAELADAEWLAGWIAVSRLNKPQQAVKHFERMYHNVRTPISVARASYWAGIAARQLKQEEQAAQWFRFSSKHMHTFYGQLGAYAMNSNTASAYRQFFKDGVSVASLDSRALRADLAQAARILQGMGRDKERDMFLRAAMNDAMKKDAPQAVIPLALQLGSRAIALTAAKAAYDKGILVPDALFPQLDVPRHGRVEKALTLAIIRQESLFDRHARSSADARGLMQLLPGTARQIAREVGVAHNSTEQLYQERHNMVLGQAYLDKMMRRYNDNVILAAAAYNAGPGNVDKWLAQMGDPQKDPYSWIDWAERIPFYETRNYVQRIWEAYHVYRHR